MGIENDAIVSYLEDNARFADLFNMFCFGGKQVIRFQELQEASEVYPASPGTKGKARIRDIKKRLGSGICLKILAVEAQNAVSYIMPWRVMEYDCKEYGKQVRKIQQENQEKERRRRESGEKAAVYADAGERLGRFCRSDRIAPVYTICLYHGAEGWDGPRCLKDMVGFAEEDAGWACCFADYPMRLVSTNDPVRQAGFKTSLGMLFTLLSLRKDKGKLKKLIEEDPAYQKLDEDTADTAGILMGVKLFTQHKEKYKNEKGYNMCQAIKEMMQDSWAEGERAGWTEGEKAGIRIFIQSNRDDGLTDAAIADKLRKYYDLSSEETQAVLSVCTAHQ